MEYEQVVLSDVKAPVNPGLWLPIEGTTTQFFFHSVADLSTCSCFHCEASTTSLILPVWL